MAEDNTTNTDQSPAQTDTGDDTELCAQCSHSYYEHDEITGRCEGGDAKCSCVRFITPDDLDDIDDESTNVDDEDEY